MAEAIVERKSIAETTKRVFLEDIFRKCNNSGTFILILDERTLPVLKRSLTKFEIMSEGCGVIENLHESRASQSDAEVIYFIEPSKKNIEALLEDFDTKPAVYKASSCWEKLIYGDITLPSIKQNKYGRVHLVFQGSVPDALYTRIKANKVLLSVLCSFREVHMDFQVIEKNIFSLGQAGGVEHLWGGMGDGPGMIRAIARQLMNVCVTMNEYPFIRYKAGYPCEEIAMAFQNEIDNYQRSHEKWQFLPERATVFIVDRTNDSLSPFLHEFTYQAMVYDLLDVKNDTYKYQAETGKGMVDKTVLLQDSDSMWAKHKHSNIYETQKDLQTSLKAFMEDHKAFQMLQSGQKDMLDMETLNKTVAGLPEYQENISVFSRHITITKHAMNVFTSSKLQAAALLEQTLATGFDQDKKAVKVAELYKNLQMRFADAEMPLECKVRLLALFLITQDGIKEEWRKKLVDIAKIDSSSESALGNLRLLGINTLVDKPNVKRSTFKPSSKESDFVLSRFTPLVKDMLVGEFERTLTTEDYPYIVEPPPKATTNKKGPLGMSSSKPNMAAESKSANNSAASVGTAQSRRTKKPGPAVATNNWAAKPTADDKPKAKEPDGPRVILFIAGGMTYSEMRVAAEVEKEYGAEILIGSTHIITPKIFMEDLKKLDPEIKLDI